MKKLMINFLAIAGLSVGLFAFDYDKEQKEGGIKGVVTPAEGAKEVVAVLGRDTLRSQMSNGGFIFSNVKRGVYTLVIKTNAPYKLATIENVAVTDSATTDIGEIKLLQ